MKDRYGRPVTSIRISVTNDCDLNCFYCHREGCLDGDGGMAPDEIGKIVRAGTEFGIEKVKITGGEPLIRQEISDVVSAVNLPSVDDVSMTTNGTKLAEKAEGLREAGLDRINVSLDTLSPVNYELITGQDKLNQVLDGIDVALDAGLWPVKLNMLVLKGINDDEVERLTEYSLERGTILQIIELLRTPETRDIYDQFHLGLDPFERSLEERADEITTRRTMQARRKYLLDGGEVEIVNPMHNSEFCAHCTRLRLTPDGYLKPCLMRNDNLVDIITPIRDEDWSSVHAAYLEAIERREPYYCEGSPQFA